MSYKPSDSDKALFRSAMKDVRPLKKINKLDSPIPKKKDIKIPRPRLQRDFTDNQDIIPLSDHELNTVAGDTLLSFCRSGVQPRYFKALQKGLLKIEADLDLHGLTVDEARTKLMAFVPESILHHRRVVRIIHGKGQRGAQSKPLLKNKINSWLRQFDSILAFSSTLPRDGGAGAVYVLLARKR